MAAAGRVPLCGSQRLFFLLLLASCCLFMYILRVVLSIAIDGPEGIAAQFGWSNTQKGFALGAFYYGYVSTQVPGGWVATRCGGKRVLIGSMVGACATAFLRPLSAHSFPLFVATGVASGMAQGPLVPAIFSMLGSWFPQDEYAQASFQTNAGMTAGSVVAMVAPPLIMRSMGWEAVFYLAAVPGLLWTFVWAVWATDSPADHQGMGADELAFLREAASMPQEAGGSGSQRLKTPWRAVLMTPPIWGQLVCDFCQSWFGYVVLTFLPQYMHDQLGFDMARSGLMVACPYIISFISLWLSAVIADNAIRKGHPVSTVRIWMSIVGGLPPALAIVCIIYSSDATLILILLNVCLFFQSFYSAGGALTILDLFPDYAGVIMGIDNGLNNVPGFLAPMTAGWLLDGGGCSTDAKVAGQAAWQPPIPSCAAAWAQLWWLSAGLYVFGTVVYVASCWVHDCEERNGTVVGFGQGRARRGEGAAPMGALVCDRLLFGAGGLRHHGSMN
jgi:MFS family permease